MPDRNKNRANLFGEPLADRVHFESDKQTGNFQALVRIQSLTNSGSAEVGLMLRESTAADARFAMIAATPDAYSYASRTTAGGSAVKTAVNVSAEFPNVWVLIQRIGDTIEFATSKDGIDFDFAGSTDIPSLAEQVELGPFVSSGTAGVDVRAIVTNYSVTEIGLTGRYYAGTNFETLALTRVENVDFDWGYDSPDQSVPSDYFSARWSGTLVPRYSETYTFYTVSNNGVRLWVNGQLLIDNWNSHRDTEDNGTITLVAGQSYDIKMEYYEQTYTATARLLWSSASQPKEAIPVEVLYPDVQ